MKKISILLVILFLATNIYARDYMGEEEDQESYTEDVGGQEYRFDEEGEYEGYEQKAGDEDYFYDDEGSLQGESDTEGEGHGIID